jgi:hypothetical protein
MIAHLKYARYILRHKYYVFLAGLATGAPWWRLVLHDWSKLTPAEWGPYVTFFYGKKTTNAARLEQRRRDFDAAWLHHQHANKHHWQHWILRNDNGETAVLKMPERYVREMVADWMGAGRAITGAWEVAAWYEKNHTRIILHPLTRVRVLRLLTTNPRVVALRGAQVPMPRES